jgi:hypothetical protein
LLAGEAFPGASAKNMIRVDLLDGRRLEGKSAGYCPALELWTTEGIQRIDLLALPEDLRRCFEDEAEGKYLALLRECTTVLDNATADSGKMARKVEDFIEATNLRVQHMSDDVSELEAGLHHTNAENAALHAENARLRAELGEMRQSRTM